MRTLQRLAIGELDLIVGTHALVSGRGGVSAIWALAHHRRTAPLRRASAGWRWARKGRSRRHAGADRDADPAAPWCSLTLATWKSRSFGKKPAGPPSRSITRNRGARTGSTRWWAAVRPRARRRQGASIGSARLVEESETSDLAAAEDRFRRPQAAFSAPRSTLSTAQMKGTDKDPRHGALSPAGENAAPGRHHRDRGRRRTCRPRP